MSSNSHFAHRQVIRFVWVAVALLAFAEVNAVASTNLSTWAYPAANGRLLYQPDALGNRLVDCSGVGYQGGQTPLPVIPVKITVSPVAGDNGANIQSALDYVSGIPLDSNGFRGTVLLAAGDYPIADSVSINGSGVVLRGSDIGTNGTVLRSTSTNGPANGQNQLQ